MTARHLPVSIICAFNDPDVRQRCLDRSIEEHHGEATVEYLPIDNVDGAFASAGAALNHGASLASHDVLAFVHQDVYLHSLRALEAAARVIAEDDRIGLLGAIGVDASGRLVGRIRDRVVLLGETATEPTDVDSLDEVLFMARRNVIQSERLSESSELAWHAYAVEYGLRVRAHGLRVCAVDIPLTHHSLTRKAALDAPYDAIAATYPAALPVRAPGGIIGAPARLRSGATPLDAHRWRYRWLRNSVAAHAGRKAAGGGSCVLSDIRFDIDDVLRDDPSSRLLVVNLDGEPGCAEELQDWLELMRRGRSIILTSRPLPRIIDAIQEWSPDTSMLLTNLGIADLQTLAPHLPPMPRVLGFRREIGYWMLLGAAAAAPAPKQWRSSAARPLGMPAVAR
jgi:Glycosyltransferase like family